MDLTDAEIDVLRELAAIGPAPIIDFTNRDVLVNLWMNTEYIDLTYRQHSCGCCGDEVYVLSDDGAELLAKLDANQTNHEA